MEKCVFMDYQKETIEKMSTQGGLFLTSGIEKPNTMTIGWGSIGVYWGKPIFVVPVRKSRFTHGLLEACKEFTISVSLKGMKQELAFCGSKSGLNVDKFESLHLTALPGQEVHVPVIGECDLFYECKVVFQQDMKQEQLVPDFQKKWYSDNDYHTMYYGEIVACYKK